MKVIRQGLKQEKIKRFECKTCGCVFEMDKGEYEVCEYRADFTHNILSFYAECPNCGETAHEVER